MNLTACPLAPTHRVAPLAAELEGRLNRTSPGMVKWPVVPRSTHTKPCQRKVEMSPSVQSRNVPFGTPRLGVRVTLVLPVKRRRALVAANPIKG